MGTPTTSRTSARRTLAVSTAGHVFVRATLAVALLGSAGWGWRSGGRVTARIDATVVHVSDGDTITVQVGERTEKVRILGADTPEVG